MPRVTEETESATTEGVTMHAADATDALRTMSPSLDKTHPSIVIRMADVIILPWNATGKRRDTRPTQPSTTGWAVLTRSALH